MAKLRPVNAGTRAFSAFVDASVGRGENQGELANWREHAGLTGMNRRRHADLTGPTAEKQVIASILKRPTDPYRPPSPIDGADPTSTTVSARPSRRTWAILLLYVMILSPLIPLTLFVPFRLLSSQTNQITYASTGEFYYRFAIAVWPGYSMLTAGITAFIGHRLRVGIAAMGVAALVALGGMYFASSLDGFFGLTDSGQDGLFRYGLGSTGWWTPKRSHDAVLPVYWLSFLAVTVTLCMRRER